MSITQTVFVLTLQISFILAQERPTDTGRNCPASTFDTGNYCRPCPIGTISSGRNNFWCSTCPPLRFPNRDQSGCEPCPPGHFLKSPTKCERCNNRRFSSKPNSLNCTKCPPNTSTFWSGAPSVSKCRHCGLGRYINNFSPGYGADCKDCPPFTFGSRQNYCETCPPGTSSFKFGAVSCHACPAGTRAEHNISKAVNYGGCRKCEEGTFNPLPKSDTCQKCPPGSKTHPSGTACIVKCERARCPGTCAPGFGIVSLGKGKSTNCVRCPSGKVSFPNSLAGCQVCQATLVPNVNQTDCVCPRGYGYIGDVRSSLGCVKCKVPMVSRNSKCVCLPPSKKLYSSCKCPPFTILKGVNCVPCNPAEIKKAVDRSYNAPGESKCILCNVNHRFDKKAGKCLPCPTGTELQKGESGKCHPCKNPWIDSKGKPRCSCRPGTEQRGLKCVPCRKGYRNAGDVTRCSECKLGYFANRTGMTVCERCPPGRRYGATYASVDCPRRCPTYSKSWTMRFKKQSGCQCILGQKVKTTCKSGRCRPVGCECPKGTELKDGRCVNCKRGWASMGDLEAKCMICGLNEAANVVGSSKCNKCAVSSGNLSLRIGGTKCLSCPSGSFVSLGGKCEKCPVGHRVRNGECVRCINSVNTGGDMGYCKVCRDGKVPNKSLSACI